MGVRSSTRTVVVLQCGRQAEAADARSVAFGGTALAGHTAFEEYRYDALGRRIWTRARRWCADTQGAGGRPDAVACQVSSVRRTVWDGSHELAEIEMPATDSTASTTIENDTLAITRTVPGTGTRCTTRTVSMDRSYT